MRWTASARSAGVNPDRHETSAVFSVNEWRGSARVCNGQPGSNGVTMRVLVVGATGTIGSAVVAALARRYEVIAASLSRASLHVDLADRASIASLLKSAGQVDAIVSAAGVARFAPLSQLSDD